MTVMRGASAVLCLVFLAWAYFQLNDPDAWAWVLFYGAAALASGLYVVGRMPRWLPGAVCVAGVIWALTILPEAFTRSLGLFLDEEGGEPWREAFGLLLAALWGGVLAWHGRPRQAAAR